MFTTKNYSELQASLPNCPNYLNRSQALQRYCINKMMTGFYIERNLDVIAKMDEYLGTCLVHGNNIKKIHSGGIAGAITRKWPQVSKDLNNDENPQVGRYVVTNIGSSNYVVSAYTQENPGSDFKLEHLEKFLNGICEEVNFGYYRLLFPAIGCGIGGGNIKDVVKLISKYSRVINSSIVMSLDDEMYNKLMEGYYNLKFVYFSEVKMTLCIIQLEDSIFFGWSFCSSKDQYVKVIGRQLAFENALSKVPESMNVKTLELFNSKVKWIFNQKIKLNDLYTGSNVE